MLKSVTVFLPLIKKSQVMLNKISGLLIDLDFFEQLILTSVKLKLKRCKQRWGVDDAAEINVIRVL